MRRLQPAQKLPPRVQVRLHVLALLLVAGLAPEPSEIEVVPAGDADVGLELGHELAQRLIRRRVDLVPVRVKHRYPAGEAGHFWASRFLASAAINGCAFWTARDIADGSPIRTSL